MTADPGEWDTLIDAARQLLEPVEGLPERLRNHLVANNTVARFAGESTAAPSRIAYVDGALATEQTDALVWVAAVGATHADTDLPTHEVASVLPVSGDTDRATSALMATCELQACISAVRDGCDLVVMDGGIATPLVSVVAGLMAANKHVRATVTDRYDAIDLTTVISDYVAAVLEGRVCALPKQDTAAVYTASWAQQFAQHLPDGAADVLSMLRDRPLLTQILAPGEWVRPRPANLTTLEAKTKTSTGVITLPIDVSYERLRDATTLHATYFAPQRLPGRIVKVEYAEGEPGAWDTAQALIGLFDSATMGPRVREPLGQHLVDAAAKRAVTALMGEMLGRASRALGQGSVDRYRTVRV